jgi:hypothetical protein
VWWKSKVNCLFGLTHLFTCCLYVFVPHICGNTSPAHLLLALYILTYLYHCSQRDTSLNTQLLYTLGSRPHPSIRDRTMPRTKQTCKKLTGGVAPCITLNLPGITSRLAVGTRETYEEERLVHNNVRHNALFPLIFELTTSIHIYPTVLSCLS